ncbi:MAG: hypothetical protein F6K19_44135, partial [Cyanothece sp. SIO1E1]|nr:hypothetical protein [Cyanothece sp. SIO1E1]
MELRWSVVAEGGARPVEVTATTVRARMDAGLAAGRDVIAFGTGGYKGVAWMKPGDTQARSLPHGADCLASTLFVCDRKIVAVRDRQVLVFDTTRETLHEIPGQADDLAR